MERAEQVDHQDEFELDTRTAGLLTMLVWSYGQIASWSIGMNCLVGFVLREEPCTDPYARFCGRRAGDYPYLLPDIMRVIM